MNCDRLFKLTLAAVLSLGFAACTTAEAPAPEEAAEAPAEAPAAEAPAAETPAAETPAEGTETAEAPAEAPAAGGASVLKSGTFVGAEHPTSGTARIVSEGDKTFVELGEDFQTDEGPDLFVTLHKAEDVLATTEPPAYPLKEGEYVTLEMLQGFSGTSRYEVPQDVNLDEYNSVVIWCRQFNATFGTAKLAAAQ